MSLERWRAFLKWTGAVLVVVVLPIAYYLFWYVSSPGWPKFLRYWLAPDTESLMQRSEQIGKGLLLFKEQSSPREWHDPAEPWSKYGTLTLFEPNPLSDGKTLDIGTYEPIPGLGSLDCEFDKLEASGLQGYCTEGVGQVNLQSETQKDLCFWEAAVTYLSTKEIAGVRSLDTEHSDPRCSVEYRTAPRPFAFIPSNRK